MVFAKDRSARGIRDPSRLQSLAYDAATFGLHTQASKGGRPPGTGPGTVANARLLLHKLFEILPVRYRVSQTERRGVATDAPMRQGASVVGVCPGDAVYCFAVIGGNHRKRVCRCRRGTVALRPSATPSLGGREGVSVVQIKAGNEFGASRFSPFLCTGSQTTCRSTLRNFHEEHLDFPQQTTGIRSSTSRNGRATGPRRGDREAGVEVVKADPWQSCAT